MPSSRSDSHNIAIKKAFMRCINNVWWWLWSLHDAKKVTRKSIRDLYEAKNKLPLSLSFELPLNCQKYRRLDVEIAHAGGTEYCQLPHVPSNAFIGIIFCCYTHHHRLLALQTWTRLVLAMHKYLHSAALENNSRIFCQECRGGVSRKRRTFNGEREKRVFSGWFEVISLFAEEKNHSAQTETIYYHRSFKCSTGANKNSIPKRRESSQTCAAHSSFGARVLDPECFAL